LFIALGFGLYGGVYLFPLFTQGLLGFNPTETGLALLPGGLATAVSAIICGRLLSGANPRIDPRLLIYVGVAIFTVSMWDLGHMTLASGRDDTAFALLIRGLGLGFLFTPINQVAYGELDPRYAQQASGLINLARQLGGSFGIAILGTYLQAQADFHRTILSSYMSGYNPIFNERLHGLTSNYLAHGYGPPQAVAAATKTLDGMLTQQSLAMAYDGSFMMILVVFVGTAPFILLLRRPKRAAAPADAH
jgi:DHA2 family multidrug resistance protein